MVGFSWKIAKEKAVEKKLYRAKIMSGGVTKEQLGHPDWVINHATWVRNANSNPAEMNKFIKDKILQAQENAIKHRLKQIGK